MEKYIYFSEKEFSDLMYFFNDRWIIYLIEEWFKKLVKLEGFWNLWILVMLCFIFMFCCMFDIGFI